jgi:hypothetical protein
LATNQLSFYKVFEPENQKLKEEIQELKRKQKVTPAEVLKAPFLEGIRGWGAETLSSFTGLQSFSSVEILIKLFASNAVGIRSNIMDSQCQAILFLMKLRLDLPNKVLATLFSVSSASVGNIFNLHLTALHQILYGSNGPMAEIPTRNHTATSLPKCFKKDMSNCRVVVDCTEIKMQEPSQMDQKKIVYSNYKGACTMKVLIGCAPNGVPVFVSDLYGGSESDKGIVLKSNILNQLMPGDLILADKGFELFDILPSGVTLNIPSFLDKEQFTLKETYKNRAISRARIIVERLNARFKVYKILNCVKAKDRAKANMLVKVCVGLTLFMPTLMRELDVIQ